MYQFSHNGSQGQLYVQGNNLGSTFSE